MTFDRVDGVPPNFKLTKDNVYLLKEGKDKSGETHIEELPACSRIEVVVIGDR